MALPFTRVVYDSLARRKLKKQILAMAKERLRAPGDGMQLLDSSFTKGDNEKAGIIGPVLQEICHEHPQYSIIMWGGGPALVLTGDVEDMPTEFAKINKRSGIILTGDDV